MKRVIDEKTLKALYPPMETAFETQMRQTLRSLPVERRHRGARRKPAAVLVAAAVLALLAATALAIAALSGFFTEAAPPPPLFRPATNFPYSCYLTAAPLLL